MQNKAATFIGHRECWGLKEDRVKAEIERLIINGVTEFYNGGMGDFDWMCARLVFRLKQQYPHIKNYLVIPYLTFRISERSYFDEVLFPEGLESCHFKAAIPKRNRFLVQQAGYALCYVKYSWGGAAQTYKFAQKQGLSLINLAESADEEAPSRQ